MKTTTTLLLCILLWTIGTTDGNVRGEENMLQTNNPLVTLLLSGEPSQKICFSGDIVEASIGCIPLTEKNNIRVTSVDGEKTIIAIFTESDGTYIKTIVKKVFLDTTAPIAPDFTIPARSYNPAILINNIIAPEANSIYISGDVLPETDHAFMWIPVSSSVNVTLRSGFGEKKISIQSKDVTGNVTLSRTHTIFLADAILDQPPAPRPTPTPPTLPKKNNWKPPTPTKPTVSATNSSIKPTIPPVIVQPTRPLMNSNINANDPTPWQQKPGMLDSDHDGLSDTIEAQYHTNPLDADTDHDSYTDAQEILLYNTDPLDAKSNPETHPPVLTVTNVMSKSRVSGENLFLQGTCSTPAELLHFSMMNAGTTVPLGSTICRPERLFALHTNTTIPNGDYTLTVSSDKTNSSYTTPLTVDNTNAPRTPKAESLDTIALSSSGTILSDVQIVITNQKPTVYGKTMFNTKVMATFESILTSSMVVADSTVGDFAIAASNPLDIGQHQVTLYALSDTGTRSAPITIPFSVTPEIKTIPLNSMTKATLPMVSPLNTFLILLLIGTGGLSFRWYISTLKKKENHSGTDNPLP